MRSFVIFQTKQVEEAPTHNPVYTVGCLKAVGTFINEHALTIGGVLLGILLPQVSQARNIKSCFQLFDQKGR